MLTPHKHLKLNTSLLHLSTLALAHLHKYRSVSYQHLYGYLEKRAGPESEDVRVMFGPTISFLYLLGKVQYHPKNDTFEYLETAHKP